MKTINCEHSQYTTCQDSAFCCQIYSHGKNVYQSKCDPPGLVAWAAQSWGICINPPRLYKPNQNPPHPGGRNKSDPVWFGH